MLRRRQLNDLDDLGASPSAAGAFDRETFDKAPLGPGDLSPLLEKRRQTGRHGEGQGNGLGKGPDEAPLAVVNQGQHQESEGEIEDDGERAAMAIDYRPASGKSSNGLADAVYAGEAADPAAEDRGLEAASAAGSDPKQIDASPHTPPQPMLPAISRAASTLASPSTSATGTASPKSGSRPPQSRLTGGQGSRRVVSPNKGLCAAGRAEAATGFAGSASSGTNAAGTASARRRGGARGNCNRSPSRSPCHSPHSPSVSGRQQPQGSRRERVSEMSQGAESEAKRSGIVATV